MMAHAEDHGVDVAEDLIPVPGSMPKGTVTIALVSRSSHSWLNAYRPAYNSAPARGLRYDQDAKIQPGWLCQGCSRSSFISCMRNLQIIVMLVFNLVFHISNS